MSKRLTTFKKSGIEFLIIFNNKMIVKKRKAVYSIC